MTLLLATHRRKKDQITKPSWGFELQPFSMTAVKKYMNYVPQWTERAVGVVPRAILRTGCELQGIEPWTSRLELEIIPTRPQVRM